jgi:hypothetical protein
MFFLVAAERCLANRRTCRRCAKIGWLSNSSRQRTGIDRVQVSYRKGCRDKPTARGLTSSLGAPSVLPAFFSVITALYTFHNHTLLYNAAGQACPSTAKRGRVVRMVVASHVNHQGTPLDIGHLQPRRQNRVVRIAGGINIQGW